jgi:hypothetical protein
MRDGPIGNSANHPSLSLLAILSVSNQNLKKRDRLSQSTPTHPPPVAGYHRRCHGSPAPSPPPSTSPTIRAPMTILMPPRPPLPLTESRIRRPCLLIRSIRSRWRASRMTSPSYLKRSPVSFGASPTSSRHRRGRPRPPLNRLGANPLIWRCLLRSPESGATSTNLAGGSRAGGRRRVVE